MLVILESPFAGSVEENLKYAHRCVADCLARGESPYASHIMLTTALDDAQPDQRMQGINAGLEWASRADKVVFYVDHGISQGMHYALEHHLAARRPVEFRYLEEKAPDITIELKTLDLSGCTDRDAAARLMRLNFPATGATIES